MGTHCVNTLRRGVKEPLVHFVVLGIVLFGLHHRLAPATVANRIELSESVVRGLRQDYLRRNGALPAPTEEAALIQRFVDDEVLYREALAEGLDRGDIIVRRRLVQKMEFIIEGLDPLPEPSDAELQAYLDAHAERYAVPDRVTMTHVFVSPDRHPAAAEAVAAQLRQNLLAGAEPSTLGDPFLRGQRFALRSERELAAIFGTRFAARVMSVPAGGWSEPLQSSYGAHLVRVAERRAGYHPALAEVRAAVLRDWQEQRRSEINRAAINRLRQRYDVRIEAPATTSAQLPHPLQSDKQSG